MQQHRRQQLVGQNLLRWFVRDWRLRFPLGVFVFTSNVDGHFQRAGFAEEQVVECHGSIHFLQCVDFCRNQIWPSDELRIDVDTATIRATSALPQCPDCRRLARPNILMFYDADWISARADEQLARFEAWRTQVQGRQLVTLEFGAGPAVPTVRHACERYGRNLIRVNPREAVVSRGNISLPIGALEAINALNSRL